MIRSPDRRGSVLLIAIGITAVCLAMAFSYLSSIRTLLPAVGQQNLTHLARSAARMGANQALAALTDNYCRSRNVPTHYRQSAFKGFRPIDSDKVGWATATVTDNRPWGAEGTPEDVNGNDVGAEDNLVEKYLIYKGRHINRVGLYENGVLRCHPLGRWIEPGNFDPDLARVPVSFHLQHPVAANPSSPDPAIRAGEPWTPPASQPGVSYFDAELRPVATRAEARYRIRFANTIEDLSGHVYITAPGTYTAPTRSPAAVSPQTTQGPDDLGAREISSALAERWQANLSAMVMSDASSVGRWSLVNLYRGLGMPGESHDGNGPQNANGNMALASIDASNPTSPIPQVMCDYDAVTTLPAGEPDANFTTKARPWTSFGSTWIRVSMTAGMRGPVRDFETLKTARWSNADLWTYAYTPYGRGSTVSDTPAAWDEARTECPWRFNVPTLTLQAIYDMVYGFLPAEARTYRYRQQSTEMRNTVTPTNPDGSINWNTAVVVTLSPGTDITMPGTSLRDSTVAKPMFDNRRPNPGDPYPGTAPTAPGTGWRTNLGLMMDGGSDRSVSSLQFNRGGPMVGLGGGYYRAGPESILQTLITSGPIASQTRVILRPSGAVFRSLSPLQAYTYDQSYWWDIGTALLQTFGTAMYVWHDETGASWSGAPNAGRVMWPAGHRLSTQTPTPAAAAAAPAIDTDADGDGVNESPGLLNSVEEMDRLFISNMGEWWGDFATTTRPTEVSPGLYVKIDSGSGFTGGSSIPVTRSFDISADRITGGNIKKLLDATTITADHAKNMELVLNDTRLSFFGCSPQYPTFRGIDFDDDGTVWCVGYANGNAPADPTTGKARSLDTTLGDQFVCLTGYVVFQQSRFFRVFTRGEVFDEMIGRAVAKVDLDSVFVIDPDGSLYDVQGQPKAAWNADPALSTGLDDSQVLYQRWTRTLNLRAGITLPP
jgi:hypothetical protein